MFPQSWANDSELPELLDYFGRSGDRMKIDNSGLNQQFPDYANKKEGKGKS